MEAGRGRAALPTPASSRRQGRRPSSAPPRSEARRRHASCSSVRPKWVVAESALSAPASIAGGAAGG
eukprot:1910558-Alexandrium_andersonii.AAC.1